MTRIGARLCSDWDAGLSIERSRVQIPATAETWLEISAPPAPQLTLALMSTLTVHCRWEDKLARKMTGRLPLYARHMLTAEAKKHFIPMVVTGLA